MDLNNRKTSDTGEGSVVSQSAHTNIFTCRVVPLCPDRYALTVVGEPERGRLLFTAEEAAVLGLRPYWTRVST